MTGMDRNAAGYRPAGRKPTESLRKTRASEAGAAQREQWMRPAKTMKQQWKNNAEQDPMEPRPARRAAATSADEGRSGVTLADRC